MTPSNARRTLLVALTTAALLVPVGAAAHDVPASVLVRVFVAPGADSVRVLVRAPLVALRDVDFPADASGDLDLERLDAPLRQAVGLWIADELRVYADGHRLNGPRLARVRVSLPSDRAFAAYPTALAHLGAPALPPATRIQRAQALVDAELLYGAPDAKLSAARAFAVEPRLRHLGLETVTVLRYVAPDGAERAYRYTGDPGRVLLDPGWHQVVARFVGDGFRHVLAGLDHLLFVVCLVIPVRRMRPLIAVVTAFTVAHSLTLGAALLGMVPTGLWFPPLIETLIAASILLMALDNLVRVARPGTVTRRWLPAFVFGLVHGFGFAFALEESLQFAGANFAVALAAFNVGIELAQLLVLAVTVPALAGVARLVRGHRWPGLILSALIAHGAWHWLVERGELLWRFPWRWPAPTLDLAADLLSWLLLGTVLAAVLWLLSTAFRRWLVP